MTRRRNIRDVQVNRRYGALCARERLRIRRLLQLVMNFAQLAESDALGEEVQRIERHHAALIAAIVCNIWHDRTRLGPVRQQPPLFSNITETEAWYDFRLQACEIPISLVVAPAWPARFSEYFRCFFMLCLLEVSR